jgi:hypothetical protein
MRTKVQLNEQPKSIHSVKNAGLQEAQYLHGRHWSVSKFSVISSVAKLIIINYLVKYKAEAFNNYWLDTGQTSDYHTTKTDRIVL